MTARLVEVGFFTPGLGGVWFHPMGTVEGLVVTAAIVVATTWITRRP